MRSLVKFTEGSVQALVALIIMALAAYAMTRTSLYTNYFTPWVSGMTLSLTHYGIPHQDLASLLGGGTLTRNVLSGLLGTGLILLAWRWLPWRQHRLAWLGAGLIGLVVGLAFWVTGGAPGQAAQAAAEMANDPQQGLGTQSFTFSAPLGDVVYYLQHPSHLSDLTFGVLAVFGLLLGSIVSMAARREWRLTLPRSAMEWLRTVIGAALVGIGSVLAMGCTVGHGLSGISTLAAGSMLSLAAIMLGAWVTLRWVDRAPSCAATST